MPRVSVIIPTYNTGPYILETIQSVFAQTFDDYELIVVDDGSTDGTAELLAPFEGRLHYHRQRNQGPSTARNAGLALASGELISFLDADDIWFADNLAAKVAAMDRHPEVGAVFSDFEIFDSTGTRHHRGTNALYPQFRHFGRTMSDIFAVREELELPGCGRCPVYSGYAFDSLFQGNFILPSATVVRMQCARQIDGFPPHLRTQEDYEYWLRFAQRFPLAYIDHPLMRYRRHPGQLTDHRHIEKLYTAVLEVVDQYRDTFRERGEFRAYASRRAEVLTGLATVRIAQQRRKEARSLLLDSIRHAPLYWRSYRDLAVALLPSGVVDLLRGRRKRGVKGSGDAAADNPGGKH